MNRYLVLVILAVTLFCLLGYAYADDYHIKPGDSIGVTVLGETDLTKHVVVDPKGNISIPLINEIHVADLTLSQAAQEITKQLSKFVKSPQVSVELVDSAKMQVTIIGEVKTPGVYSVTSGARLMDVITTAGSYTPQASDLTRVQITHTGGTTATVDLSKFILGGDASANVLVSTGDTIFIPARDTETIGTITVLGAVREPGQRQIVNGMTVREGIMLAGGPTELADLKQITVRHVGATENLPIVYASSASGTPSDNPVLKPGDVIYVASKQQMGYYTISGGVANPGRFEIRDKLTLTDAIALAGGVKEPGKLSDVRILRNVNGKPQTLTVDVTKIMDGKAPNVLVQDQDSIYVTPKKEQPDYLKILSVAAGIAWLVVR